MSRLRDDLSLLAAPGVGALFAVRTLSMLGMSFAPVALAFGILHLPGGDEDLLSLVLAAESIPLVVLMLVGGVIADRYPRQRVLFLAYALATLAYGWLAWLVGTGTTHPVLLAVAAVVSGAGGALGWPAVSGLIPQVLPPDRLQEGNALLGFGVSVAKIVGVVAGGAVTAVVGGGWALACAGAMFAVAAALALTLRPRPAEATAEGGSVLADLRDGWGEFVSREWLWVIVAQWAFLILAFTAAQSVLGPVIADRELGGATPWSIILAGQGIGDLVGVLAALRWRPRRPILAAVLATAAFVWVPFLLLAMAAPVWAITLAMVPMGGSFAFFGVVWNTTMQREVPPEALSRVSSYDAMGSMMFGPIGLMLAGPAAAAWGPRPAMLVAAGLLLVVGLAALASRDVRTLTWRPEDTDEPDVVDALPLAPQVPAP